LGSGNCGHNGHVRSSIVGKDDFDNDDNDHDHDDDHEAEIETDEDTSRYTGNAFQDLMCKYKILTAMIKSNRQNNFVSKALDEAIDGLTKEQASETKRPRYDY
jgi:phage I-like protein